MLKRIRIRNFRSLKDNFVLNFEENMTLIVGENDAGKTTLVDAIKVILQGKKVELDDFSYGTNELEIELELGERTYLSNHFYEGTNITSKIYLIMTHEKLNSIKNLVNTEEFIENIENFKYLKNKADWLNIGYRSNTGFNTLKSNIITRVDELLTGDNPSCFESKLPNENVYFLDGKHFEDVSLLINELYFREKRKSIWSEPINEVETIEIAIRSKLSEYASTIRSNINDGGIKDKIKEFLPGLTEIAVTSDFETKDLNISVNVRMLEGDKEISIAKKGDGTKRRITMALLDYQNDENEGKSIYILDEADTHLHVKAQLELINVLNEFIDVNKQVVITTHSPFFINACKPQQIRLLKNYNNISCVKYIQRDNEVNQILRNIGIENTYLFFAKKILIVEGETEEKFIPIIYERVYGTNLYSNLIKIINVKGIKNVPGFARAILELNSSDNIYSLIDNDAEEETIELIDSLGLDANHKFQIGTKEFEDSFDPSIIYNCWKVYVENSNRRLGDNWTETEIRAKRDECLANNAKFSKKLRELNSGCQKKLDKITLGIALGDNCSLEELDERILNLLSLLRA